MPGRGGQESLRPAPLRLYLYELHFQVFQQFIDQHCGPDDALEESQYAKPQAGGVADVIDPRADQAESIHRIGRRASVDRLFLLIYLFIRS